MAGEILTGLRQSDAGVRKPPEWLAAYVDGYVVDESAAAIRTWCVPHGRVIATIDVGGSGHELASPVAGLHDGPLRGSLTGGRRAVAVLLTPWGAHTLFRLRMHELTNVHVSMNDLLGRAARELSERLMAEVGWPQRFALLDSVLSRWFASGSPSGEVVHAWQCLVRSAGTLSVKELAVEVGWSQRRLQSRFRDQIGLPPKTVARIFRFQRAVRLLLPGDRQLGSIAAECGYSDQAHLNLDFRALAGKTPSQLLTSGRLGA
jgi:AraC-like DNA-binding protein